MVRGGLYVVICYWLLVVVCIALCAAMPGGWCGIVCCSYGY